MDIGSVRARFQSKLDFFVSDYATPNKNQMLYSLQQDSTKYRDIHLYVTSFVDPKLEGKQIRVKNQDYLVYKAIHEPYSNNQWTYMLLVLSEIVIFKEVKAQRTAIGASIIETDGNDFRIDGDEIKITDGVYLAYLNDRMLSELNRPTVQAQVAVELTISIPRTVGIDLSKNYEVYYNGLKYKVKSASNSFGATIFMIDREI